MPAQTIHHRTQALCHISLIDTGPAWMGCGETSSPKMARELPEVPQAQPRKTPWSSESLKFSATQAIHRAKKNQAVRDLGRYSLAGPHQWGPFCPVPPGACKHQPPTSSHRFPPQNGTVWAGTKARCVTSPLDVESMKRQYWETVQKNKGNGSSVEQKTLAKHQVSVGCRGQWMSTQFC